MTLGNDFIGICYLNGIGLYFVKFWVHGRDGRATLSQKVIASSLIT